jgi:hypothetical protein
MKKKLTKMVAGISSAAILTSFSALAVPAFAAEYEAVEAADYVATFAAEDETTQKVVQYLVDNTDTLSEAKSMMDDYLEGLALIESRKSESDAASSTSQSTLSNYYNSTTCTSSPHYAVIIQDNGASSSSTIFTLSVSSFIDYDLESHPMTTQNGLVTQTIYTYVEDTSTLQILASITGKSDWAGIPKALYTFFVGSYSGRSEASIRNGIHFGTSYSGSTNKKVSTFELQVGSLGDIDHNGIIDAADRTYITQACVDTYNETFEYSDVGSEVAEVVASYAFDTNQDGVVDLRDPITVNNWLS